ncbi:MAG: HAMP domain-containing sensor histidine kinase [Candidatus Krumholzibacteria bacterium]|jgi:signal transduction histidine kinase|nr:HAMP domain-containing sensor histidine kinase [Candidatus Krumholzibacteria bacterium]MDP6668392.1 HAMP domain-containing sensor histidine kinase [Candidatus Krumholzibacteria bacterium]MDP6797440.1 HAMP domain-containing sensor histidine kinase [Candidatus Krumholzibacteria bacterium]MDP7022155.1 HAMP domain-containing sensor histidine kinase [Candidatus Krumholzibacteria bacterium]
MRLSRYYAWIYWILLLIMVAQSSWWVIYLSREGDRYLAHQYQRFQTDRLHAAYLIEAVRETASNPSIHLEREFPHLSFDRDQRGRMQIRILPSAEQEVQKEARRRRNMFLGEGIFFITLLLAGSVVLTLAWRREMIYRQSRELLLAGVTHEFKTPLASLQLFTETLGRKGIDEAKQEDLLVHMREDIARLDGMVGQVLAVSRLEKHRITSRERIELQEELLGVLNSLSPFLENEKAKVTNSPGSPAWILGDRLALSVVLRNLIQNSVQYSEAPAKVSVELIPGKHWHRILVRDQGVGIPRSQQKKVFRSFYRIGESGVRPKGVHGAGLGLYLVNRNTRALGGRIELESRKGVGSTFTVILPAMEEEE